MAMKAIDVSFAYDKKDVLQHISFEVEQGKITAVLGANGSGKSTLFSVLTKNLVPKHGKVYLKGRELSTIKVKEFSRSVAVVHQHNSADDTISVEQLVSYGRLPYERKFRAKSAKDEEAIEEAISATGLMEYRDRAIGILSGGQRQRVFIAMALAQQTEFLLLDEPTTFLDIRYQMEILELIQRLNKTYGITILMILHDINQALRYSHSILGLRDGRLEVQGETKQVISEEVLQRLYGVKLKVVEVDGEKIVY